MEDRDKVALRSAGKNTIDPSVISIGGKALVPLLTLSPPPALVAVVVAVVVVSVYALPDLINNKIDAVGSALKWGEAVGEVMVTSSNSNSEHTATGGLYISNIQYSKIVLDKYKRRHNSKHIQNKYVYCYIVFKISYYVTSPMKLTYIA